MTALFEVPVTTIETTTGEAYPVRRVFCIGRNYAAHAREMGRDPDREPPFFFTKWAETVVPTGTTSDRALVGADGELKGAGR